MDTGSRPRRRTVLAGVGTILGAAAGCLGADQTPAASETDGQVRARDSVRDETPVSRRLHRVVRLVAFVAIVDGVSLGTVVLAGAWTGFGIGLAFVALLVIAPVFVALFVAPAAIVIDGDDLVAAARKSLDYAVASPVSIPVILVGLGYVGYALTGVSRVASSPPTGAVLATVVSVTVAGTVHAVAVAALHSAGPQ